MNIIQKVMRSDKFFQIAVNLILCVFLVIQIYPIIYVISASVSAPSAVSSGKLILFPVDFTLEGYKYVFQYKDIWIGYGNTVFYLIGNCYFLHGLLV